MANKKFSEFVLKTDTSGVSHIVGYNGAENVQITPANFLDTTGGPYLPLAGGTMVGNTTHNDNVRSLYGTSSDLQIYHDAANSYVRDVGTGNLFLDSNGVGISIISDGSLASPMAHFYKDGAVELYNTNIKKFETTSTGANVSSNNDSSVVLQVGASTSATDKEGSVELYRADSSSNRTLAGQFKTGIPVSGIRGTELISFQAMGFETQTGSGHFVWKNVGEKMRLTSAGNLGIGTSNPGVKLEVAGTINAFGNSSVALQWGDTSAVGALSFDGSANPVIRSYASKSLIFQTNGANERMRISSLGNALINHTPGVTETKLYVEGSEMPEDGDPVSVEDIFTLYRYGSATVWSGAASLALGRYFPTGSAPRSRLDFKLKEAPGSNTALPEVTVMTMQANGFVGVGITTPKAKMHILDGTAASYTAPTTSDTLVIESDVPGGILLVGTGAGSLSKQSITFGTPADLTGAHITYDSNNSFMSIGTVSASNFLQFLSGNGSESMRLDASGNCGIGTSSPTTKLNVSGGISIPSGDSFDFIDSNLGVNRIKRNTSVGGLEIITGSSASVNVLDNGNVGIGITSPNYKLSISDSTALTPVYQHFTNGTTGTAAANGVVMGIDSDGDFLINNQEAKTIKLFTNDAERMRLDTAGNLSIGTTTNAGYRLKLQGTGTVQLNNRTGSDGAVFAAANDGTIVGTITVSGSATSYNTSSDYRLKEDLQDFKGLDLVSKIPVYDYKWKADDSRSYGVMAHQLQDVLPQAVTGDKDAEEMQAVDYSKIVPVLVKAIQELKAEIELLKQ